MYEEDIVNVEDGSFVVINRHISTNVGASWVVLVICRCTVCNLNNIKVFEQVRTVRNSVGTQLNDKERQTVLSTFEVRGFYPPEHPAHIAFLGA